MLVSFSGSVTQASTVCLGNGPEGEVYVPLKDMLPMVNPDDVVIDGKLMHKKSRDAKLVNI